MEVPAASPGAPRNAVEAWIEITEELTSDRMALQLSAAQPTPQTTIIAKSASKPLSSMG